MFTDRPPPGELLRTECLNSERLRILEVPEDERVRAPANSIEVAMNSWHRAAVGKACSGSLITPADFYSVGRPQVRVLAARPLRVHEGGWAYNFSGITIRSQRLKTVPTRWAESHGITG
jgi:hypothetical protein